MKKLIALLLCMAVVFSFGTAAFAEETTKHVNTGVVEIDLPSNSWFQVTSEENTAMFSDGDCAIFVNLYKNGDKLPEIASSDINHEFIYTAACSTSEYILLVTGYAHERSDFSGICKAINSLVLYTENATEASTNHTISVDQYAIKPASYTAWVCSGGLNVRSDSSTNAGVITVLSYNDPVTVTGLVTRNGAEIGWALITTSKGITGYVSTQFLTTQSSSSAVNVTPSSSTSNGPTRTGSSLTMYRANGSAVILYYYSDNNYRDDAGVIYVGVADGAMKNNSTGELVYNSISSLEPYDETDGYYFKVVGNDGDVQYLCYIGSDIWVNKNNIEFYMTGVHGEYKSQYGYYFHSDEYVKGTGTETMPGQTERGTDPGVVYITISDEEGATYVIHQYDGYVYISNEGYYFYATRTQGVWVDNNEIYYYDSTFVPNH